jgi:TetR/AcrR family transcriptional repressor of nem operon
MMLRGRPRGFDEGEALESAMLLFWQKGYQRVNLTELCKAMHAPRQSVYHVFGDKRALFLRCIHHYTETRLAPLLESMRQAEDPINSVKLALNYFLVQSEKQSAQGCFVANTLIEIGEEDDEIKTHLKLALELLEKAFYRALVKARSMGVLSKDKKPIQISRALTNSFLGLAILSKSNPPAQVVRDVYSGALSMLS